MSAPAVGEHRDDVDSVSAFWRDLGLPGLIDVHVHFMPERVLAKVWAYFDSAGPLTGRRWPINYRLPEGHRLGLLRAMGVRAFPSLVYPHKPGMAEWLNGWAATFAAETPGCLRTATFFPEPAAGDYVRAGVADGVQIFKAHVQVGRYDPRDPQLEGVWGTLAESGVPVVAHVGSGPVPGPFTGPGPIGEVLARYPRLRLIVAHLGGPEYGAFLDLAARYEGVHLDTAMAFTDFMHGEAVLPAEVRSRLADLGERVLFGSDFPNIPYAYGHQLEALRRLELGDDWLRAVCYHNAARLLGVRKRG